MKPQATHKPRPGTLVTRVRHALTRDRLTTCQASAHSRVKPDADDALTIAQAARATGCSSRSLRRWAKAGLIPGWQAAFHGEWLLSRAALDAGGYFDPCPTWPTPNRATPIAKDGTMKTVKEPAELRELRGLLVDLDSDARRLADLIDAAAKRLKRARKADDDELNAAAQQLAGLREAAAEVEVEHERATTRVGELEELFAAERAQRAHATARERIERARTAAQAAADAAVDALLQHLGAYRESLDELKAAHQNATRTAHAIGVTHREPAGSFDVSVRHLTAALGRLPGAQALAQLASAASEPANRLPAAERRRLEAEREAARPEQRRLGKIASLRGLLDDLVEECQRPGDLTLSTRDHASRVLTGLARLGEPVDAATLPPQLRAVAERTP